MLGLLRKALDNPAKSGLEVRELVRQLTKFTPTQIHGHMAAAGLAPAR